MFEYWQDAGARGKPRSRSPREITKKKRSPVKKSLKKIGKIVTFKNGVKADCPV